MPTPDTGKAKVVDGIQGKALTHGNNVAENEPSWGDVDKTKLPRVAYADTGEEENKSTWAFPHHWVENPTGSDENDAYTDGDMFLHRGGLDTAWSAAQGARSGQEASDAVKAHLQAHRSALGIDSEEGKTVGNKKKINMIPAELQGKSCPMTKMLASPVVEGKSAIRDPGYIEGYAAAFGNIDFVGDVVMPGAFAKTIKERVAANKVKLMCTHLKHGGGAREVIGTVTQAKEDDVGLWMHAELSSTRTAQEIRRNVLDGHIGNLSIGYVVKDSSRVEVDGKSANGLKELAWYETTVTATPANEQAIITAAKAEAVLGLQPKDGMDDATLELLGANRDNIQELAAKVEQLMEERLELLDTEPEADISDADAESNSDKDTDEVPDGKEMTEAKQRAEALAKIMEDV